MSGPNVCPKRMLVILIPRAEATSSDGKLSDKRATLEGQLILHRAAESVYMTKSVLQSEITSQEPNKKGSGIRQPINTFFRPNLSASHPLGI